MSSRIEKNRKHLSTLVAFVFVALLYCLLERFERIDHQAQKFVYILILAVLLARTIFIEAGIRRRASKFERKLGRGGESVMKSILA